MTGRLSYSVDCILAVLADATPEQIEHGVDWYPQARLACRRLARKHGLSVGYVARVVAALSPRTHWGVNLQRADQWLGNSDLRWMPSHNKNLERILRGEELSGPKVRAFCANIMGTQDRVCVDVWATRVAECEAPTTEPRYRFAELAYRTAAARTPYSARDLQAITWTAYRGVKPSDPR